MNTYYSNNGNGRSELTFLGMTAAMWSRAALRLWENFNTRRGLIFGTILFVALLAFEVFNFSTTDYALTDLMGELKFAGLRWATILSIAFCGIDFAGLARLFTPERGQASLERWYLLGAWFLGAGMNAVMTWWAVSLAMVNHQFGNEIMSRAQLLAYVPVFVAALVWITRILIIGSFSIAGERLFSQAETILIETRRAAASRPVAAPRPVAASQQTQRARVIGSGADDDPFVAPNLPSRPIVSAPAQSFRPATRPAPRPVSYRPAPTASRPAASPPKRDPYDT